MMIEDVSACVLLWLLFTACGNSRCEYGEECANEACSNGCAVDCPAFSDASCPGGYDGSNVFVRCSGHGSCAFGASSCSCFRGYSDNNCGSCGLGYVRVTQSGTTSCVFLPGALTTCDDGVRNGNEVGVDCGGPNCGPCAGPPKTFRAMVIGIGAVVGGIAVFIASIVGVRLWNRWKRGRVGVISNVTRQPSRVVPKSSVQVREVRASIGNSTWADNKRGSHVIPLVDPVVVDWAAHEHPKKRNSTF